MGLRSKIWKAPSSIFGGRLNFLSCQKHSPQVYTTPSRYLMQ
jgi:hypothetical protein